MLETVQHSIDQQADGAPTSSVPTSGDAIDLPDYFRREATRQPRYLGQLNPDFQAALVARHAHIRPEQCDFYHSADLSDGSVIRGEWDLRSSEDTYLGNCDLRGKRVIEYGPASGGLSSHIARNAAELVVFDLPFGAAPELVPFADVDTDAQRSSGARSAERLRNAWWYMKNRLSFAAKAVYGDIYEPPDDLKSFDVAVFGCILLHLSHPFRALQRAAAMTTETIIVTDVRALSATGADPGTPQSLLAFNPSPAPVGLIHWWALSPQTVAHMLCRLGFEATEITLHAPLAMGTAPLFTVVGHRPQAAPRTALGTTTTTNAALAPRWPAPPPRLRFMVSGTEDLGTFLALGRRAHDALLGSIKAAGIGLDQLGRILDFGCGAGRVIRYWDHIPGSQVVGTDYFAEAIEWDRAHLTFAEFETNELSGPLSFASGSFGLVYALSVFTHLPVAMQMTWFAELVRILRPGGLLYFTTHGPHYASVLDGAQLAKFTAGEVVVTGDDQPGTNHCAAFHPPAYVTDVLVPRFGLTLLQSERCGAKGNPEQDSYLLRKNGTP